ncbi:MAG: CvpA family protein [Aerococcaceae bacterium]|nr:CvpA family protein [Aerococcaceae bacterium]
MLTFIIILTLVYGFYTGYRRGVIMQVIRLIGYIVSAIVATKFSAPLSKIVEMLIPFPSIQANSNLVLYNEATRFLVDQAFYRAITFMFLMLVGWLLTNFIGTFFTKVIYYDVFKFANHLGGGLVNLLITYGLIFFVLFILSLIPIEFIQQQFVDSPLAYWIVSQTPIVSEAAAQAWLQVNPFR